MRAAILAPMLLHANFWSFSALLPPLFTSLFHPHSYSPHPSTPLISIAHGRTQGIRSLFGPLFDKGATSSCSPGCVPALSFRASHLKLLAHPPHHDGGLLGPTPRVQDKQRLRPLLVCVHTPSLPQSLLLPMLRNVGVLQSLLWTLTRVTPHRILEQGGAKDLGPHAGEVAHPLGNGAPQYVRVRPRALHRSPLPDAADPAVALERMGGDSEEGAKGGAQGLNGVGRKAQCRRECPI